MESPSSDMRVSTTWVSRWPQKGHFIFCVLFACWFAVLLYALFCAGLAEGIWYWPLPHAGVPEIVSGQYQTPSVCVMLCFARKLQQTREGDKVAKQRANHFRPQTARVAGTAGDDFWYPSMKSPPYLQSVPFPARTPDERKLLMNNRTKQRRQTKNPDTQDGG